MCGIFCYIEKGNISKTDRDCICNKFSLLQHRGPDHTSQIFLKKFGFTIFLGFHRLAIIDPTPESNRILQDEGIYMICNGEIYNYKYLIKKHSLITITGSDCEVILQLYKKYPNTFYEYIQELDGVFAFVIFDSNLGKILVSRDRVGVRPLFKAVSNTDSTVLTPSLCFTSEGKASYLNTVTPYKPGILATISLQEWKFNFCEWVPKTSVINADYTVCKEIIQKLLIHSVEKRLISDRPIGFLVSGGLDSSLVAAIASKLLGKQINTFSIGLQSSPDLLAAAKVANFLNSNHTEIIITENDILRSIPKVIYYNESYDTTTTRASIPMYLLLEYISKNTDIKVIFSGEGADELFGGYLYFHNAPSHSHFQKETFRLLDNLYKYDLIRGDRMAAACGLEVRVPFLDADLLTFVKGMDPCHKMPHIHTIEKAIIRRAFDEYLPDDILYRQKEAFSDGVGYNSVKFLKDHADTFEERATTPPTTANVAIPTTNEEQLYYYFFCNHYVNKKGLFTEKYWLPLWCGDTIDPSATVLNVHSSHGGSDI